MIHNYICHGNFDRVQVVRKQTRLGTVPMKACPEHSIDESTSISGSCRLWMRDAFYHILEKEATRYGRTGKYAPNHKLNEGHSMLLFFSFREHAKALHVFALRKRTNKFLQEVRRSKSITAVPRKLHWDYSNCKLLATLIHRQQTMT